MSKKPKWEKCPVCEGSGNVPFSQLSASSGPHTCPHCHGARIISRKTGRPPVVPQPLKAGKGITMHPDMHYSESLQGYIDRLGVPDEKDIFKAKWNQERKEAQDHLEKVDSLKEMYERKAGEEALQYRTNPLEGLTPFMTIKPEWLSSPIKIIRTYPLMFYMEQITAKAIGRITAYLKDMGVHYVTINESDSAEDAASGCPLPPLQLDISISPHRWQHFIKGDWLIINPTGSDMALYQLTNKQHEERFKK